MNLNQLFRIFASLCHEQIQEGFLFEKHTPRLWIMTF